MELNYTANREARLNGILRGELRMSTGLINRLKWNDGFRVNGVSVHVDYPVHPGDRITVLLMEEAPDYPAQKGNLSILYEDDWLLAVDKPAGMLIHPSSCRNEGTLANYVQGYYRSSGSCCAFHPMTRLDRDTYGIVLIAKNSYVSALLQNQKPIKTYHAVTYGVPEPLQGVIDAPIARRALPSLLREIRSDGKPCLTRYRVLTIDGCLSFVELIPVTGRTHQLRLHCAHIGCPILGDPQYGSEESRAFSETLGIYSQLLCAVRLSFAHPVTGKNMELSSQMDARIPQNIQPGP